jgi:hypothetical protein
MARCPLTCRRSSNPSQAQGLRAPTHRRGTTRSGSFQAQSRMTAQSRPQAQLRTRRVSVAENGAERGGERRRVSTRTLVILRGVAQKDGPRRVALHESPQLKGVDVRIVVVARDAEVWMAASEYSDMPRRQRTATRHGASAYGGRSRVGRCESFCADRFDPWRDDLR